MYDFDRIEEARERWIEGGTEYDEWRARIHGEEEWDGLADEESHCAEDEEYAGTWYEEEW